jgi:hypothetical protein
VASELVLVGGANYAEFKSSDSEGKHWTLHRLAAGPWRDYSMVVAKRSLKADSSLRVTFFDFVKGTRETIRLDKRGQPVASIDVTTGPLLAENYRQVERSASGGLLSPPKSSVVGDQPHVFYFTGVSELSGASVTVTDYKAAFYGKGPSPRRPTERSLSIIDVYHYLETVGSSRPNTVAGLHLFCHAWAGGPILANTVDVPGVAGIRDPLDKDGRRDLDFPAALASAANFKKAFASDAKTHVWGCNAFIFMKQLIHETIRQKAGVRDPAAKRLRFTWSTDWVSDLTFFHSKLGGSGNRSDLMSVNDVIAVVRSVVDGTYMKQLAGASGGAVLGGLPGTYSDLDHAKKLGDLLLHVPMGAPFDDDQDFRGVLGFYNDQVGVAFDPKDGYSTVFGRGYGVYT